MSVYSFNLKSSVNSVSNPTVDGIFCYGFDNVDDALFPVGFNLFNKYGYTDNSVTPLLPPYDLNKIIGWFHTAQQEEYLGLAYEHLTPHFQVQPQPFPNFGIYVHPTEQLGGVSGSNGRKSPVIRFKIPIDCSATFVSNIQRATIDCGSNVGYSILKNGVDSVHTRSILNTSNTPTTINSSATFLAGDIVDFKVDNGDDGTDSCDDTALDITVNLTLTKLINPIITTSPIDCSTDSILGTATFAPVGTMAYLYDINDVLIISVPLVNSGYSSTFNLNPIDLTTYGGQNIKVRLENGVDTPSDFITLTVSNTGGCVVDDGIDSPTITKIDLCNRKCSYQRKLTGTADFDGFVAIYKAPMNPIGGNVTVASGIIAGGVWEASSESIVPNQKYVAYGIRLDGIAGGLVTIDAAPVCDKECVLVGTLIGKSLDINNGIIILYDDMDLAVATGLITNDNWSIKQPIDSDKDYYLVSIKLI